jgi:hypothetical protein
MNSNQANFIVFAGMGKPRCTYGGFYDFYRSSYTMDQATEDFFDAIYISGNKWTQLVSLETMKIIKEYAFTSIENDFELKNVLDENLDEDVIENLVENAVENLVENAVESLDESLIENLVESLDEDLNEDLIYEELLRTLTIDRTPTHAETKAKDIVILPDLDLEMSKDYIKKSRILFGFKNKPSLEGPTTQSNVLIPGILIVGAYPDKPEVIQDIKKSGINTFVCLNSEYGRITKQRVFNSYAQGLTSDYKFVHAKIKDMGIGKDKVILNLCKQITEMILNGDKIYLHCSGGHGRTGTVASIVLYMLYGLPLNQIFDYVQFAHDQRIGKWFGSCYFTIKIDDPTLAGYFAQGQVPSPQTTPQRDQVERLINNIIEGKSRDEIIYNEAKKNYDGDEYLQQHGCFEDWFQNMKKYDKEESSSSSSEEFDDYIEEEEY